MNQRLLQELPGPHLISRSRSLSQRRLRRKPYRNRSIQHRLRLRQKDQGMDDNQAAPKGSPEGGSEDPSQSEAAGALTVECTSTQEPFFQTLSKGIEVLDTLPASKDQENRSALLGQIFILPPGPEQLPATFFFLFFLFLFLFLFFPPISRHKTSFI